MFVSFSSSEELSSDVVSCWTCGLNAFVPGSRVFGVSEIDISLLIHFFVSVCRRSSQSWSISLGSFAGCVACIACSWLLGTGNLDWLQGSLMLCIGAGHPPQIN